MMEPEKERAAQDSRLNAPKRRAGRMLRTENRVKAG